MKGMTLPAIAVVFLLCPSVFADQITLKNGDRLTGSIERSDEKMLVIKTEAAGEVAIQWSAIESIKSDQQLHVGLAGGQVVVGPVSTSDGQIEIATKNAGTITTTKDAIQVIRSDSDQAAYDAAIERLQHPHLGLLERTARYWLEPDSGQFCDAHIHTLWKGSSSDRSRQNHCLHHCGLRYRRITPRQARRLLTKFRAAFGATSTSATDGLHLASPISTITDSSIWTFKT